jgi:aldehyde:ferredoxin oxidoreductase
MPSMSAINEYYRNRGWTENGTVPDEAVATDTQV